MPKVYQRASARRDLMEQFVYLAENAALDTTERFLTNAETSFNDLADQPMIGAPRWRESQNVVSRTSTST